MLNKENFAKRLEELLKNYEISASALADKIGIQRSSISHLLSGRNNPSLDFVIKILDNYPEISFDWFVKGIGTINEETYTENKAQQAPTLFENIVEKDSKRKIVETQTKYVGETDRKTVDKIVLLYSDGTFKTYKP